MSTSRTGAAFGCHLMTVFIAALVALAFTALQGSSARAGDLPFWEQADHDKAAAKTVKRSGSAKSHRTYASKAKKSYASNSSNKPKLGGYAEQTESPKKKHKGVKVAALGNDDYYETKPKKSLSGGGSVNWTASASCLDSGLRAIVYEVASNYGPVTVNSTCRSRGHNAAVGGASHSKHLSGDAVDFRVHGHAGAVYAYLKGNGGVGGLKHYGGGLFHIDNGDRRSW